MSLIDVTLFRFKRGWCSTCPTLGWWSWTRRASTTWTQLLLRLDWTHQENETLSFNFRWSPSMPVLRGLCICFNLYFWALVEHLLVSQDNLGSLQQFVKHLGPFLISFQKKETLKSLWRKWVLKRNVNKAVAISELKRSNGKSTVWSRRRGWEGKAHWLTRNTKTSKLAHL